MKWWLFAGLLAVALAAGLAADRPEQDSKVASVANPGPRGLKVLATWLTEAGAEVQVPKSLKDLGTARTLVIAAPETSELSKEEIASVFRFVEGGGTLIFLAPRSDAQRALKKALGLRSGDVAPLLPRRDLDDLAGSTVTTRFGGSLLEGTQAFRVSADRTLKSDDETLVPAVSDGALWWQRRGQGEIWVGAGADLAENARLELLDNALFWSHVAARGPVAFDESHHSASANDEAPMLPNLVATALQLGLCGLLFGWVRGRRLGPARPTLKVRHRSALEYVDAMASLTHRAGVDDEVLTTLRKEARVTLHEKLGIGVELPEVEAITLAAHLTGLPQSQVAAVFVGGDLLTTSQALSRLEARLSGKT